MSTALAIASVTAVLKDLLQNGLVAPELAATVGEVAVTALPPDRIDVSEATGRTQLNLFLYHVTPNAAWRNVGLPSRAARGELLTNPPLALDLHYLLTAYGARDLHAEILLGYGMQLLHETPVLAREAIRLALNPPGGGDPSPELLALFESELDEQVEQVKITPESMSMEELSKLWSAFDARYRPTANYLASVVLIEGRKTTRAALPVRARNIYVKPFRQPVVEHVMSRVTADAPVVSDQPVLAGHVLVLVGRQLRGDDTLVEVGGVEVVPPPANVEDARISVALPVELRAGVQGVRVVHRTMMGEPPAPHPGVSSNVAAFVLSPRITSVEANVTVSEDDLHSGTLDLTIEPAIGAGQRVVVFLNELGAPASRAPLAYSFNAPPDLPPGSDDVTNEISAPLRDVATGAYLARVQVDGAESPLSADAAGRFNAPQVTIP